MSVQIDCDFGDWLDCQVAGNDKRARLTLRSTHPTDRSEVEVAQSLEGLTLIAVQILHHLIDQNGKADGHLHRIFGEVGTKIEAAYDRVEAELAREHGVEGVPS